MKRHTSFAIGAALIVGLLLTGSLNRAFSQDQPPDDGQYQDQNQDQNQNPQQDPPSRVARLNYSSGSVSFQPGGEGDWVQAVINRPLTTGDNLWTDQNSRAELHVGSTAMRMSSETSLTFLQLDDRTTQLRLSMGTLLLRVRHLDDGDLFEVDTPNLAFEIQRVGEYRIEVNPDGNQTITTVWHGRGEVSGGGSSYTVVAGQSARFSGTEELDHEIDQLPNSDDFDNWAFGRDEREDHDESSNYISSEMTGYEDLDDYGHWRYAAGYGPVWAPAGVPVGWAPYRYGHWVFVEPWGWTWVEDEPWGFAPFHYGRWAFVESSWCWIPGPVVIRPVYAPALVAFVGGGGFGLAVGIGGPGVAWFPLGPREVYVPPYRVSRVYVNNVNITNTRVNVTQITNVYNNYNTKNSNTRITYVNQRIPSAVTAVSHETFVNARPVARNLAQVDQKQIAEAPVSHIDVRPARASVIGAGAPMRSRPPAAVEKRQVVATRNPAPPRAPFEQRQQPAPNVRTVQPGQPQPAGRAGDNNVNRGNEPRPNQSRPSEPVASQPPRPQDQRPQNQGTQGQDENTRQGPTIPRPPQAPRPDQGAAPRPDQGSTPRPSDQVRGNDRNQPSQPERQSAPDARAPRPPQGNQRDNEQQAPHPLVRQAPPPEEKPQQQRNEEDKFRTWQQQRQNAPRPPAESRPADKQKQNERPPQQKQDRPKDNKDNKKDPGGH